MIGDGDAARADRSKLFAEGSGYFGADTGTHASGAVTTINYAAVAEANGKHRDSETSNWLILPGQERSGGTVEADVDDGSNPPVVIKAKPANAHACSQACWKSTSGC